MAIFQETVPAKALACLDHLLLRSSQANLVAVSLTPGVAQSQKLIQLLFFCCLQTCCLNVGDVKLFEKMVVTWDAMTSLLTRHQRACCRSSRTRTSCPPWPWPFLRTRSNMRKSSRWCRGAIHFWDEIIEPNGGCSSFP